MRHDPRVDDRRRPMDQVRHRRRAIAHGVGAIAGALLLLAGCRPSGGSADPPGTRLNAADPRPLESTLAVGTFNIRFDNPADGANRWSRREALVIDILGEGDLWGLQEALPSQVEAIAAALPGFGVVSRTRERDPRAGEACPILYRRDRLALDPDDHGTFWLSETPDEPGSRAWDAALPRIATWARFVARDGRALYLFNTHFDHRGEVARRESARVLLERIAARAHPGDPVIVVGDLNAGPGSGPVRRLLASESPHLLDAWRHANPAAPEQPTFNGWGERCEGARIDWILVSGGLEPESCTVDLRRVEGRWPSDHAPVVARMRRR